MRVRTSIASLTLSVFGSLLLVACGSSGSTDDGIDGSTGAGAGPGAGGSSSTGGKSGAAGTSGAAGHAGTGGSAGSSLAVGGAAGAGGGGAAGGGGGAGGAAQGGKGGAAGAGGGQGGTAGAGAGGKGGAAGATGGHAGASTGGSAGSGGTSAGGASGAGGKAGSGGTTSQGGASGQGGTGAQVCTPGELLPCYSGPPATEGVGVCVAGNKTCKADGSGFDACQGQVLPTSEVCDGTLNDENCNGMINEGGSGCTCTPGNTKGCYSGPMGTQGVGVCHAGTTKCDDTGTQYGGCVGEVTPTAEVCDGTLSDENCDGKVNDGGPGCTCVPGATGPCYDGPPGTLGVGICQGGTAMCDATGMAFGTCMNEIVPLQESCATAADDDCNGSNLVCTDAAQECGPNGNCVSACDPALIGTSNVGCEYYAVQTANLVDSSIFHFAVTISNGGAKPAAVTITRGASTIASQMVAAGAVATIDLPWDGTLKGPNDNGSPGIGASARVNSGAFHITSTRPVAVYQFNALEYQVGGSFSYTNDASLLLPINTWTGNYRVASRHQWRSFTGLFAITTATNGTNVTIAAGPQTGQIKAGVAGIGTNGAGTVTLNAGDIIQLVTNGGSTDNDPNDPTGMLITADKPVQVIGGHECTNVPDSVGYCDHLEESMFPIETLSTDYLITSPLIATNTPKVELVRIIATAPNTTLTYDPPQAGAPAVIAQAGGWVELPSTAANFHLTASDRVMVVQYMEGQDAGGGSGDPAMVTAVTTAQYRKSYLFNASTTYSTNFVNVTAPTGAAVTLDGAAVTGFTAIGNSGYGVARVPLSNSGNGSHNISSAQSFGISVYGYGQYTSYWYAGGLDLRAL